MTREEAKREILFAKRNVMADSWIDKAYNMAIQALSEPERKKGEWIKAKGMMPPEFHGHHYCSECGDFASMDVPYGNRENLSDYCPNCGADMREDDKQDERIN